MTVAELTVLSLNTHPLNTKNTLSLQNTTRGWTAKMGHRTDLAHVHAPMLHSEKESIVICPTCGTNCTVVLTTPYGKVCSGCFKRIYVPVKNAQSKIECN